VPTFASEQTPAGITDRYLTLWITSTPLDFDLEVRIELTKLYPPLAQAARSGMRRQTAFLRAWR
jgi:hypothetical protein